MKMTFGYVIRSFSWRIFDSFPILSPLSLVSPILPFPWCTSRPGDPLNRCCSPSEAGDTRVSARSWQLAVSHDNHTSISLNISSDNLQACRSPRWQRWMFDWAAGWPAWGGRGRARWSCLSWSVIWQKATRPWHCLVNCMCYLTRKQGSVVQLVLLQATSRLEGPWGGGESRRRGVVKKWSLHALKYEQKE